MDVESDTYVSVATPTRVRAFIDDVGFGDGGIRYILADSITKIEQDSALLAFDTHMAALACENAITNAKTHGLSSVSVTAEYLAGMETNQRE
jgi:hypothetical protein